MEETTPLVSEEATRFSDEEAPPNYDAAVKDHTQPVMPSAPPRHLDPYPPPPDPNARTTTTTTTTYVTTTETRTRERSCCQDTYCPGFIFCFFVPTPGPGPAGGNCDCCNCLPPTSDCHCAGCNCGDAIDHRGCGNNPVGIIFILIMLALFLVALIGIIAFLIYRMGDGKPPAIAKRYRIFAVVFALVAYAALIGGGIALAELYYFH